MGDPADEWRRIVAAVAEARREIEHVRVVTARDAGAEQASIFDAHLSLLADAEMLADVKARVGGGRGAVAAWVECLADVERTWAALPDPYLRERAADVACRRRPGPPGPDRSGRSSDVGTGGPRG